jgi:fluoroacetyl-CoA thioesterase
VAARQGGKLVGSGEVTRVVVDAERFLARVPPA